jgi:hypothetical protein
MPSEPAAMPSKRKSSRMGTPSFSSARLKSTLTAMSRPNVKTSAAVANGSDVPMLGS